LIARHIDKWSFVKKYDKKKNCGWTNHSSLVIIITITKTTTTVLLSIDDIQWPAQKGKVFTRHRRSRRHPIHLQTFQCMSSGNDVWTVGSRHAILYNIYAFIVSTLYIITCVGHGWTNGDGSVSRRREALPAGPDGPETAFCKMRVKTLYIYTRRPLYRDDGETTGCVLHTRPETSAAAGLIVDI